MKTNKLEVLTDLMVENFREIIDFHFGHGTDFLYTHTHSSVASELIALKFNILLWPLRSKSNAK